MRVLLDKEAKQGFKDNKKPAAKEEEMEKKRDKNSEIQGIYLVLVRGY